MNNSDQKKSAGEPSAQAQPKKQSVIESFKHLHISMDDAQANKSLKVTGLVLLSLLCLFVFVKTVNEIKGYGTIGQAPEMPNSITVNGHAEVMAKRDVSSVSFSSFGEGKTTSEAQSAAAESNNKAIAFLKSKGIPEGDIATQSYNTSPKYDQTVKPCVISAPASSVRSAGGMEPAIAVAPVAPCNSYEQVIVGYETNQTIQVKIRGIDKNPGLSGEILDGLAATGVRVGSLTNSVDDMTALQSEARSRAIASARIEASRIAKSLGVRVVKVVSYYENNYGYPMAEGGAMSARAFDSAKSVAPEVPAGESLISSDVSVTFEIR